MIDLIRSPKACAQRHLALLISHFDDLLPLMDDTGALAKRNDSISKWSVGEQLEHVAKVDGGIFESIGKLLADPSEDPGRPIRRARMMLLVGFIPRGRGRSPEPYVARGIDPGEVRSMLEQRRQSWIEFEPRLDEVVASRSKTPHPLLGQFTAAQWVRFAQVHARHHQKIIDDILNS